MKKLLVLSLVLIIVGSANAILCFNSIGDLSFSITGNTLTLSSTVPVIGYQFALMTDNGSALSNAVIPAGFGAVNSVGRMIDGQWDGVCASVGASSPITGQIFSINFAPGVAKIYFVYSKESFDISSIFLSRGTVALSSEVEGVAGSLYTFCPEPCTLMLLGLGGLLIRKR